MLCIYIKLLNKENLTLSIMCNILVALMFMLFKLSRLLLFDNLLFLLRRLLSMLTVTVLCTIKKELFLYYYKIVTHSTNKYIRCIILILHSYISNPISNIYFQILGRIYYHRMWVQLSTTCSNLLK